MSRYTYNNYYDPVGSQSSHQPQGYTYAPSTQQPQQPSSTAQYPSQSTSDYSTNYPQSYNNAYGTQQYSATGQQRQQTSSSNSNRTASALSSLNNQNYAQNPSDNRSGNVTAQYDNAYYGTTGFSALNDRSQSNNSPIYGSNATGATFGRLSLPDQSQPDSNTFTNSQTYQSSSSNASTRGYQNAPSSASRGLGSYQNAYNPQQSQQQPAQRQSQAQKQQQQPQRYASPLHAVQAQQGHNKQPSRTSNHAPSPQISARNTQHQSQDQRHQSASVEPSPTTVDPSQVYDIRAEQQRKAQIEADKRRKLEAARKAEEEARAAEEAARKAEEDRIAEVERLEREKREAEEEAAKKKAAQERKNEQRRKAREEKRQSKTAATALTQMASGSGIDAMAAMMGDTSGPPANDEEAEMRAMFAKMREFNARNPAMLAKLWEEERRQHSSQATSPQPAKAAQSATSLEQQPMRPAAPPRTAAPAVTPSIKQPTTQQQYRPKPIPTPATQAPPQPVAPQTNGSLWPEKKKDTIAEAAAHWLNTRPENSSFGRRIEKEVILKLLEGNPSYVQLCEVIEKKQLRFERSAFAKELLKAVPDEMKQKLTNSSTPATPGNGGATPSNGAKPSATVPKNKGGRPKKDGPLSYSVPTNKKGASNTAPVAYQSPVFHALADAAREVNSMSTTTAILPGLSVASAITADIPSQQPVQSPYFGYPPINNAAIEPQSQLEVKAETPAQPPEEPPRPPADKEEAARKRTFGDLVDLTKGDDSDDDGPPRKIQLTFGGLANGAVKHQSNNEFKRPMDYQTFMRQQAAQGTMPSQGAMANVLQPQANWSAYTAPNKPNAPILPSQPVVKHRGPTEEQKQYERMRGKMLVEPIMRDRVARKSKYDSRTIARDILLATGRHPDMRALNAHLNPMQKLLGDHGGVVDGAGNKSDLSTIRWDIIDPGEPAEDMKAKLKTAEKEDDEVTLSADDDERERPSQHRTDVSIMPERQLQEIRAVATPEEEAMIGEDKIRRKLLNRLHQRQWRERHMAKKKAKLMSSASAQQSEDDSMRGGSAQTTGKKPVGRPRKSLLASSTNTNDASTPNGTPVPRATPGSTSMASGSVGYAAFGPQYDEHGKKKQGRPVGWRKSLHSREAAGLAPIKSGAPLKQTRHQPPGSAGKEDFVQPKYQIYKCNWRDCAAELDNLDRLKKHVLKFHGIPTDNDDLFECWWQPCRFAGKHSDADGNAQAGTEGVTSFENLEHWMQHVDKEHLAQVAWKLGDGPKGGSISENYTNSDAYLSDAYGRVVTPIIVPLAERVQPVQSAHSEEPILVSDLTPAKKVGGPLSRDEREATAELGKLKELKTHEGITMGREGSRLAIEKRRRGLLDDEDFEDIIEESD